MQLPAPQIQAKSTVKAKAGAKAHDKAAHAALRAKLEKNGSAAFKRILSKIDNVKESISEHDKNQALRKELLTKKLGLDPKQSQALAKANELQNRSLASTLDGKTNPALNQVQMADIKTAGKKPMAVDINSHLKTKTVNLNSMPKEKLTADVMNKSKMQALKASKTMNLNTTKGFNDSLVKFNKQVGSKAYQGSEVQTSMIRTKKPTLKAAKADELMQVEAPEVNTNQANNEMASQMLKASSDNGANLSMKGNIQEIDLSNIDASNTDKIIEQVSNYIVQASTQSAEKVQMRFTHDELGSVDIQVLQAKGDEEVSINIMTTTKEGSDFFKSNRGDLLGALTNSGIQVSDLKLENGNLDHGEKDSESGHFAQKKNGEYNKEDNNDGEDRRQELWDLLRDRRMRNAA